MKNMNKVAIKVFKRDKNAVAAKSPIAVNTAKIENDIQLRIVNAVNNWISERRENSRM
jgi:hypothetical protein